jgi:hypothetical protein
MMGCANATWGAFSERTRKAIKNPEHKDQKS